MNLSLNVVEAPIVVKNDNVTITFTKGYGDTILYTGKGKDRKKLDKPYTVFRPISEYYADSANGDLYTKKSWTTDNGEIHEVYNKINVIPVLIKEYKNKDGQVKTKTISAAQLFKRKETKENIENALNSYLAFESAFNS